MSIDNLNSFPGQRSMKTWLDPSPRKGELYESVGKIDSHSHSPSIKKDGNRERTG
jgi:hypothetical protein